MFGRINKWARVDVIDRARGQHSIGSADMSKTKRPASTGPVQIPSAGPRGASQAQFDEAVKLVSEMTIPDYPAARKVAQAMTGLVLTCQQYLQQSDGAGLEADLGYMLPILEWFTEVLGSKVPPTRVEAIEGVLALMMAKTEGGAGTREPDVGIDLRQVTDELRKGE
jgi:hypothetical protein